LNLAGHDGTLGFFTAFTKAAFNQDLIESAPGQSGFQTHSDGDGQRGEIRYQI
jgi:hypothetical protein